MKIYMECAFVLQAVTILLFIAGHHLHSPSNVRAQISLHFVNIASCLFCFIFRWESSMLCSSDSHAPGPK